MATVTATAVEPAATATGTVGPPEGPVRVPAARRRRPGTDASASPHGSSGPNGSHGDDAKDRSPQVDPSTGEVVEASPVTALAAGVTDDAGGGPPLGALLALVAVAALGAGGWFLRRRQIARGGG